jgi:ribonuclease P protein component
MLTAYGTAAGRAVPRVGITVSGAVGGAVVRNLVRRRVQGALAALPPAAAGTEVVLVLRPQAAAAPYATLAADVAEAVARVGRPG